MTKRKIGELRPLEISDRMETIAEISKVISKEEVRAKAKQILANLQKTCQALMPSSISFLRMGYLIGRE